MDINKYKNNGIGLSKNCFEMIYILFWNIA